MTYNSDFIPTDFATNPAMKVSGEDSGLVTLGVYEQDGNTSHAWTMRHHRARQLALSILAITDAITDTAEAELDAEMSEHPHVSARWLGEMGREQRSN